jgi:hypothetical protein
MGTARARSMRAAREAADHGPPTTVVGWTVKGGTPPAPPSPPSDGGALVLPPRERRDRTGAPRAADVAAGQRSAALYRGDRKADR